MNEEPFEIPETTVINLHGHALGVSINSPIHIRELSNKERSMGLKPGDWLRQKYECRAVITLFGNSNMTDEELKSINYNPFHPDLEDNYCSGFGNTHEECLESLKKDMESISQTLFY